MASCDVQPTPSGDNVEEDSVKAEGNSEAGKTFESRLTKNGTVPQPTKIPGPVRLDDTGSYIHTSTRKYTTLMKVLRNKADLNDSFSSTSTLVNTTDDSGIQLECSSVEEDKTTSANEYPLDSLHQYRQPNKEEITTTGSLAELEVAEQQTLRVLQRAVAEMEADVAMHAEMLEEQMQHDLDKKLNLQLGNKVQPERNNTLLHVAAAQQNQQQQQQQQEQPQQQQQTDELEERFTPTPTPHSDNEEDPDLASSSNWNNLYPSSDTSGIRERKHVRVEELLEAEHDIELLHKLLQVDSGLPKGELTMTQSNENRSPNSDLNADKELVIGDNIVSELEVEYQRGNFLQSLLHIFCGKRIRNLSYPILFCGMAVGLIYFFRKD